MPPLDPHTETLVARIWSDERATTPSLFNGRVFTVDRIAPDRIDGHWTEYRRVLAQIRQPALFDRLHIRGLAVNGLIACPDGLLLGRRQASAIYLPGCWQAAPAGAVESRLGDHKLDLSAQLLAELDEELGLSPQDVSIPDPVIAMEHPASRIVDIGFLLSTTLTFPELHARWIAAGNAEYDALRLVPADAVRPLLDDPPPDLLMSARILMGCQARLGSAQTRQRPGASGHPSVTELDSHGEP